MIVIQKKKNVYHMQVKLTINIYKPSDINLHHIFNSIELGFSGLPFSISTLNFT